MCAVSDSVCLGWVVCFGWLTVTPKPSFLRKLKTTCRFVQTVEPQKKRILGFLIWAWACTLSKIQAEIPFLTQQRTKFCFLILTHIGFMVCVEGFNWLWTFWVFLIVNLSFYIIISNNFKKLIHIKWIGSNSSKLWPALMLVLLFEIVKSSRSWSPNYFIFVKNFISLSLL